MKACKKCKRLTNAKACPVCGPGTLTSSYQGSIIIIDVDSEVAKKLKITAPGKYAIKA